MAWYEAHQTLSKHPKTLKLASLINCERRYAVGLLHDLFTWGLDAAKKDGTLPGLDEKEIASALDFSGKKGKAIVAALVESGYLELHENTYKIHDWYDYAGKLADQREDAKRRKDEWKERKKNAERTVPEQFQNSSATVPERGRNAEGTPLPYPTVPYQNNNIYTQTRVRAREDEQDGGFTEFWNAYPRKSGDIRQAYMAYLHALDIGATQAQMVEAIKAQTEGVSPEDLHFLPSAEKWLRNKGWESKASLKSKQKETKPKQYTTAAEYKAPSIIDADKIKQLESEIAAWGQ